MHRRDFLDPRRLAESAGHVVAALHDVRTQPVVHAPDAEVTLVRYARPAMGTVFEIVLPFGHGLPTNIVYDAFELIDDLENQLSIYREDSEVSQLNRRAFCEEVKVSRELFRLLQVSLEISQATQGAFDITAGALVETWGFVRGPRRVPGDLERQNALARCGWRGLQLNETNSTVRFLVEGMMINLGSIGKGYALDCVASFFRRICPGQAVLLHGGKSCVIGVGSPPGHPYGWSVAIEHPWNPTEMLQTVVLQDRAMATSAATYKHLIHQGRKLGHILDPRTGWPASTVASATALASSAAQADALSTAFFVMGAEVAQAFCRTRENIDSIMLANINS